MTQEPTCRNCGAKIPIAVIYNTPDPEVMTLRDMFAMHAMQLVNAALIARKIEAEQADFAAECYTLADAMLAAREKK